MIHKLPRSLRGFCTAAVTTRSPGSSHDRCTLLCCLPGDHPGDWHAGGFHTGALRDKEGETIADLDMDFVYVWSGSGRGLVGKWTPVYRADDTARELREEMEGPTR